MTTVEHQAFTRHSAVAHVAYADLVRALAEDRPNDLAEAWEDARSHGPRWRERLERALARVPGVAATLERL